MSFIASATSASPRPQSFVIASFFAEIDDNTIVLTILQSLCFLAIIAVLAWVIRALHWVWEAPKSDFYLRRSRRYFVQDVWAIAFLCLAVYLFLIIYCRATSLNMLDIIEFAVIGILWTRAVCLWFPLTNGWDIICEDLRQTFEHMYPPGEEIGNEGGCGRKEEVQGYHVPS